MNIYLKAVLAALCICLGGQAVAQDHSLADKVLNDFCRAYNNKNADSVFYLMSESVKQKLPLDKTTQMVNQIYGQMGELKTVTYLRQDASFYFYRSQFSNRTTQLVCAIDASGKLETFRFIPDNSEQKKEGQKGASDIAVNAGKVTIHGTLTVPESASKVPVVLLIAGSGPTNRDGNNAGSLQTNAYRQIADSLREHGIACLRYDKRGVGESIAPGQKEEEMRFDDMVNDAGVLLKMLREDARFSSVYIAGHSEGSMVGMLAAQKTGVKGYISISGIAAPAYVVLAEQLKAMPKEKLQRAKTMMDSIKKGFTINSVPDDLQSILRPSVQPYMKSWFRYDPMKEIAKLHTPVLIIQGTSDLQVEEKHASELKKALPAAQLAIVKNMAHTLKDGGTGLESNMATYTNASLPLAQGFVNAMIAFIK